MMANNGHYLYMLNKYETSTYWTKMVTLVYQMENTVDCHLKEYENLQQTSHITFN
jgi:hypothetical protein